MNKVNHIITPSEFTKNSLVSYWIDSRKIEVIPNTIDENICKPSILDIHLLRKQLFDKYNIWTNNLLKKIILNVGSEENRKNIITILKALTCLDNCIFIKIWSPIILENRQEHIDFIKKNGLNCFFIDKIDDIDLVKFYNVADVFVFPSLFEWFGRPPIEAQACWCPVISSKKWWLEKVLNNSCIILCDPLDNKELVDKINLCLSDSRLRLDVIHKWYKNAMRFTLTKNISKRNTLLKSI